MRLRTFTGEEIFCKVHRYSTLRKAGQKVNGATEPTEVVVKAGQQDAEEEDEASNTEADAVLHLTSIIYGTHIEFYPSQRQTIKVWFTL